MRENQGRAQPTVAQKTLEAGGRSGKVLLRTRRATSWGVCRRPWRRLSQQLQGQWELLWSVARSSPGRSSPASALRSPERGVCSGAGRAA